MKTNMTARIVCLLTAFFVFACATAAHGEWYRGNTHTHTVNSDGDVALDVAVRWYLEHGYQFVALTDHDYRTPVEGLNAVYGAPGKFLVLAGVEVTDKIHLTAINVTRSVGPQGGETVVDMINRNARAIRDAGGLAIVCHPNYEWALSAEPLAAAEVTHFELFNASPGVHNWGGSDSPSTEEMWDKVLSNGRVIYGVASDDTHDFAGEFSAARAHPGRGWIVVKAPELSPAALLAAIERGDFYASTGVQLKSYELTDDEMRLELKPDTPYRDTRFRTCFIGRDGVVLKRDGSLKPSYRFQGDELYVRARVEESNGTVAWTQPVFLKRGPAVRASY